MTSLPPGPPKPKSPVRKILIICAIVLVLCCGGAGVAGFFAWRGITTALGPPRDAAVAYADDLVAGDYAGAYANLCRRTRELTSEQQYVAEQSARPRISGYSVAGVNVQQHNSTVSGVVTLELTRADDGSQYVLGIPLLKEDGQWRVCL
ncbi:Rv0361 family membrane protein [Catellatospora citrea]|uniref:DUF4878 domain-containing protein n=1 Tax=Catellatospora citrea TaxID=53366 RepID=A0A8J3NXH0_9ACTN|nr:hypothetical protein [Catellatospora citrea]RKE10960.1 hypothetical protein C8E86_5879 [Catellatospora citrea]GIF96415.1 hypothetical protein Cci01nite_15090 [Catellatospora citrea]